MLEKQFDRPGLVRDQVYNFLREAIITGRLAAGDRLREQALADRLGVSRTPVREAVRRLAQEGLLEVKPNRGVSVRNLTISEGIETYEIRQMLEVKAAGLAASSLSVRFEGEIKRALERVKSKPKEFSIDIWNDMHFHFTIADAAQNSALSELIRALNSRITRLRVLTLEQISNTDTRRQHDAIATAILDRDPEAARAAMANHLNYYIDLLRSLRGSEPGANCPERREHTCSNGTT